ncbi:recombinase family protein [Pedobacter sp. UC225_65]|uniref:recombinase family protein n=1 Tax=Pedobacter sp. UC225_65 TaxID=3350173 RepID=UPI00366EE6E0
MFHKLAKKRFMKIGYARVSTADQSLNLQIDALVAAGCSLIFEEKISGKNKDRPELAHMFSKLRGGDTVVVWKLDRLGRSLKDLIDLVAEMQKLDVNFMSIQDNINTETATGRFTFNIFASLAEFEREMISSRTKAGLASARARGRVGGRPSGLSKENFSKAKAVKILFDKQEKTMDEIGKDLKLSRSTCYRYLDIINSLEKSRSNF